jgi:hypothetical protein
MAKETFRTRRNKLAGRKKQHETPDRRIEQENKKAVTGDKIEVEKAKPSGCVLRPEPRGKPRYFSSSVRPRDPKRKSEITLHATRKLQTLPAPSRYNPHSSID